MLGDVRRPITLIEVEGEHDFDHRAVLISALDGIDGHLVVDLTLCGSLDNWVIHAILRKALALKERGHRLEVIMPASGAISEIGQLRGLQERAS